MRFFGIGGREGEKGNVWKRNFSHIALSIVADFSWYRIVTFVAFVSRKTLEVLIDCLRFCFHMVKHNRKLIKKLFLAFSHMLFNSEIVEWNFPGVEGGNLRVWLTFRAFFQGVFWYFIFEEKVNKSCKLWSFYCLLPKASLNALS